MAFHMSNISIYLILEAQISNSYPSPTNPDSNPSIIQPSTTVVITVHRRFTDSRSIFAHGFEMVLYNDYVPYFAIGVWFSKSTIKQTH